MYIWAIMVAIGLSLTLLNHNPDRAPDWSKDLTVEQLASAFEQSNQCVKEALESKKENGIDECMNNLEQGKYNGK